MDDQEKEQNVKTNMGFIAAIGFGIYGYTQGHIQGENAFFGLLSFGLGGFAIGILGFYIIKSIQGLLIYGAILIVCLVIFRTRIMALTGVDPFAFITQ